MGLGRRDASHSIADDHFHHRVRLSCFPNLTSTLSATLSAKLWATPTSAQHPLLACRNQLSILSSSAQCQTASSGRQSHSSPMLPVAHSTRPMQRQHRSAQLVSTTHPSFFFLFRGLQHLNAAYQKNIANWSTSSTPPPRTASRRSRLAKSSNLVPTPVAAPVTPSPAAIPHIQPLAYQPTPTLATMGTSQPSAPTDPRTARLRAPLPTTPQALQSTYASRLHTGATLLMQPILSGTSTVAVATTAAATSTRPRRGGVVSYADPGSGDDIPDAGEVDSDGSDFVASGGTRTAIRAARGTLRVVNSTASYPAGGTPVPSAAAGVSRTELDQSYLGLIPPARFIIAKPFAPTKHVDL
jgi:hypothetical protein